LRATLSGKAKKEKKKKKRREAKKIKENRMESRAAEQRQSAGLENTLQDEKELRL